MKSLKTVSSRLTYIYFFQVLSNFELLNFNYFNFTFQETRSSRFKLIGARISFGVSSNLYCTIKDKDSNKCSYNDHSSGPLGNYFLWFTWYACAQVSPMKEAWTTQESRITRVTTEPSSTISYRACISQIKESSDSCNPPPRSSKSCLKAVTLATLLLDQVKVVSKVLFKHSEYAGHSFRIQDGCEPTSLLLA